MYDTTRGPPPTSVKLTHGLRCCAFLPANPARTAARTSDWPAPLASWRHYWRPHPAEHNGSLSLSVHRPLCCRSFVSYTSLVKVSATSAKRSAGASCLAQVNATWPRTCSKGLIVAGLMVKVSLRCGAAEHNAPRSALQRERGIFEGLDHGANKQRSPDPRPWPQSLRFEFCFASSVNLPRLAQFASSASAPAQLALSRSTCGCILARSDCGMYWRGALGAVRGGSRLGEASRQIRLCWMFSSLPMYSRVEHHCTDVGLLGARNRVPQAL